MFKEKHFRVKLCNYPSLQFFITKLQGFFTDITRYSRRTTSDSEKILYNRVSHNATPRIIQLETFIPLRVIL